MTARIDTPLIGVCTRCGRNGRKSSKTGRQSGRGGTAMLSAIKYLLVHAHCHGWLSLRPTQRIYNALRLRAR